MSPARSREDRAPGSGDGRVVGVVARCRRRREAFLAASRRLDHMPVLPDTGIKRMILWVSAESRPPGLTANSALRESVSVSVPAQDPGTEPALQYAFVTGGASQPMAPSEVDRRVGHGINTGRNVLAGADYLYDAMAGRVGLRVPPR